MDSTRTLAATNVSAAVPATPVKPAGDVGNDMSDLFANLLQTVSNRFMLPGTLVDPTILSTPPAPTAPPPADTRNDQQAPAKDASVDSSSGKKTSSQDDKQSTSQTTTPAAQDATPAPLVVPDAALASQLSALQALIISQQQTQTPATAGAAPATQTTTDLPAAQVAPTTPVVASAAPAPVTPVSTPIAAPETAPAPVVTPQVLAAQIQSVVNAVQAPVVTAKAASTTPTSQTTPSTAAPAPVLATDDAAAPAPTVASTQAPTPTPTAQAQSAALSRLLGDTNSIRVAVTVDAPPAATPQLSIYDHFVGYSMGDDTAAVVANGQFGDSTPTNALVQQPQTAPIPAAALQAAIAAAQPVTPSAASTPATGNVSASTTETLSAAAVTSTAAVESESADLAGGFGQMSFAQSGAGGTNAAGSASAPAAANTPVTPAQVFDQIKVKITRATKAGLDQVSIQLKPEALGRVDIKLEVSPDGKVHATVVADRQDTLNLLQSDAQGLERALQDAGLRTDANSLEFSLRGDGSAQFAADDQSQSGGASGGGANADAAAAPSYNYALAAQQRGGVDTYV